MRMKKLLATVMATALAVTMIPFASSATTLEGNGSDTDVEGTGEVREPIIEVTLPGELAFLVDPLKINSAAQILGMDYNVINRSEVPVKVTVKTYLNLEGDLESISDNSLDLLVSTDATKGYKPVSSNDAKRTVTMKAIVADAPTGAITYSNERYEFSYKGYAAANGTNATLGRGILLFGENGAVDYDKLANGNTNKLNTSATNSTGIFQMGNGSNEAAEFKLLLGKIDYDEEGNPLTAVYDQNGNISSNYKNSASSFTFTGAVDPSKTYETGEINVVANFKLDVVTDENLSTGSSLQFQGDAVKTATGVSKAASGTDRAQLITTDYE